MCIRRSSVWEELIDKLNSWDMSEGRKGDEFKGTIYYDGDCPMCSAFVAKATDDWKSPSLAAVDSKRQVLPQELSQEGARREISFIDAQGRVHRNISALFKIWEARDQHPILIKFGSLSLIKPILVFGYRIVASNRYWLSKFWRKAQKEGK